MTTEQIDVLENFKFLNSINFWKRLEMFIYNVEVSDLMSEEEKDMILTTCVIQQKLNS